MSDQKTITTITQCNYAENGKQKTIPAGVTRTIDKDIAEDLIRMKGARAPTPEEADAMADAAELDARRAADAASDPEPPVPDPSKAANATSEDTKATDAAPEPAKVADAAPDPSKAANATSEDAKAADKPAAPRGKSGKTSAKADTVV